MHCIKKIKNLSKEEVKFSEEGATEEVVTKECGLSYRNNKFTDFFEDFQMPTIPKPDAQEDSGPKDIQNKEDNNIS